MNAAKTAGEHNFPSILKYPTTLQNRYEPLQREMVDQLERTAALENHWLIFTLLGWENMLACGISQYLLEASAGRWSFVAVWAGQIIVALLTNKFISGPPQIEDSPLQSVIRRVGAIFVILCCNVAVLNVLADQPIFAFLPVLATLSSFALLVLASLISPRFVAAALFMFVAGGLIASFPAHGFLIYGAAWLIVLQTLGVLFLRKRQRWLNSLHAVASTDACGFARPESESDF